MRELHRAIGSHDHRHLGQPDVHVGAGRGAPQHCSPAARPRQAEQHPLVATVEPEPGQRVGRRKDRAAEADLLAVVDPRRAPGERTAVGVGRVVAAMPPGVARRHLEPQAVGVVERRFLVGADRRPHLDDRRARRHRVVTAHGHRAVAIGEGQGQHRPAVDVGGLRRHETKRTVADRDSLVADRDVGVGGAGDDDALPVGTSQAQNGQAARAVEAEAIRDRPIADLPLTPVRRFPDERVVHLDAGSGAQPDAAEGQSGHEAEQHDPAVQIAAARPSGWHCGAGLHGMAASPQGDARLPTRPHPVEPSKLRARPGWAGACSVTAVFAVSRVAAREAFRAPAPGPWPPAPSPGILFSCRSTNTVARTVTTASSCWCAKGRRSSARLAMAPGSRSSSRSSPSAPKGAAAGGCRWRPDRAGRAGIPTGPDPAR